MSDLVEFLAARLDEDKGWAQRSTLEGRRYDRDRVLREVEAKWKILALHSVDCCPKSFEGWDAPELYNGACGDPCPTLRLLAAVWSDHPDYDEAWRLTKVP